MLCYVMHISSWTIISFSPVPPLKWYTKPVKNLKSQRNELIEQKYAVSAKLAYYLIVTPTLGLGLVLYYDVMSLVTIFSNENYVVLAKLPESAQITGDGSAKICCISKNLTSQRNELIQQKYAMSSIWLRLWLVVT